jgi:2-keto-3-deoxy-L-rhamnonate aldolase RhmA
VDLMLLTVMAAEATALATIDAIRQAQGIDISIGHLPAAQSSGQAAGLQFSRHKEST